MDQARATISKIFNGEPHSYTRFNLTQNMEGDNSQVEMKLSSDGDEEVGGNGVGDHLNHNSNRKPYAAQKIGRTPKNLCFMGATIFLIFIIGYLIGYLVHRKKDSVPVSAASMSSLEENVVHETGAAPLMDWNYVKTLLADKLKVNNFETTLSAYESANHRAGSSGDESLGNRVLATFKECGMITWAEEHFIKVQDPPAPGKPNRVVFKDKTYTPEGFLSYSATGTKTGAVVYAHYGRDIDIALLRKNNIDLKDRVVLVKSGLINFAEKVANAAKQKAAAVLIYPDSDNIASLFGHVHMGSGDPYTPGFPSFNHTQFPPIQSSGLPTILAQTISKTNAIEILGQLNGQMLPSAWGSSGKVGDFGDNITVEVNNVLTDKPIHNVFGVIKGFVDADRYMIVGAQRDAWGPGYAASTVGTSVLIELARAISDMVKNDGFKPRRSIIFASWSAGEYGSIGATEWLEGYLSSLSMKAFSYINLDGIVTGSTGFKVAASPLMHSLVGSTIKEVGSMNKGATILTKIGNWESDVLEPLKMDNAAYPFLSFSGIPAVAFRFTSKNSEYPYFGTMQDTRVKLRDMTNDKVSQLAQLGAQFAGHIVLRLVHDHLLQMDLAKYDKIIRTKVAQINLGVLTLRRSNPDILPKDLTMQWLISASGSFSRASRQMAKDILNSNLEDIEMCRTINDRLMTVERNLLSPYVSPRENPFRHIIIGFGPNTIQGLLDNLEALRTKNPEADVDLFRNQFALATWTVQGCANSLAGNVWSLDNEI